MKTIEFLAAVATDAEKAELISEVVPLSSIAFKLQARFQLRFAEFYLEKGVVINPKQY